MRWFTCVALLLSALALALAACDGNNESAGDGGDMTWTVDHLVDVDDATLVTNFNDYAESVDGEWESTPATVVGELLRLESSDNPNVSIVSEAPGEAAEEATVTVTFSRILDDSVEATRQVVDLVREGEIWRVEAVASSIRCKPGRGHQPFSGEPCL